ncbi:MAG: endonuclease [Bryobacterales bacterium]|nr:endonuclease [Bryobacterales bacterium]
MNRLAAFILIAFLPTIVTAKGSHSSSSHPKPSHVTNTYKVTKHPAVDHSSLKNVRNASAKRNFQASNPCPATGKTSGGCRGYVVDHKTPLACGGADAASNLQWQTTAEAKLKDKTERAGCAP